MRPPVRLPEGELPLPPKPEGMVWRDYLIMLLHIGADLEHSLMVQYLYAAYSLNNETGNEEQRKKVGGWRNLILTVAKEEMGHLLTVQNLLCLVGGPVCFERSLFPTDTPYLPFRFRLQPVSTQLLARYVYAEAPEDWQLLLRAHSRNRLKGVKDDIDMAGNTEGKEVLAGHAHAVGQRYGGDFKAHIEMVANIVGEEVVTGHTHTVGQLYRRILEVISNPERIPDSAFRADTYVHQASWDDWGRGYAPPPAKPGETKPPPVPIGERSNLLIIRMANRTQAIAALREISGQGEAPHLKVKESDEPSHFIRFRQVLDEFQQEGEDWSVVRNVPENPTTLGPQDKPEESTSIEQETSLLWATLFNLRYRALLTYLTHTFRLARLVDTQEPNVRGAVMHKIFGEMYNLKAIAGILVRRPLKNLPDPGESAEDTTCAAPPFEMPYTMNLPMDEPDCWRRHQDILSSSLEVCHALLTGENPHGPELTPEEVNYLRTLQQLDQKSIAWMEIIIGGLLRPGEHNI